MANTTALTITFNGQFTVNDTLHFLISDNVIDYVFKSVRTGLGESAIASTLEQSLNNLKDAINADYAFLISASVSGNSITLVSRHSTTLFSDASYVAKNMIIDFNYLTYENDTQIFNFSKDFYYINNDIYIRLKNELIGYFEVYFTNITNGNLTTPNFTSYQDSEGFVYLNISPILKGIFSYPAHGGLLGTTHNGLDVIRITIKHSLSLSETTITKRFIRGGNRTIETNQSTNVLAYLKPSEKIPVWNGYISGVTRINASGSLSWLTVPLGIEEQKRVKGCDNVYLKFLNQKGGYSFWLFETNSLTENSDNTETAVYYSKNNNIAETSSTSIRDFGTFSEEKLSLQSKVEERYIDVIKDLIVSPEIYVVSGYRSASDFQKVFIDKNSIIKENNKRAYSVRINLNLNNRFNPSLLWN